MLELDRRVEVGGGSDGTHPSTPRKLAIFPEDMADLASSAVRVSSKVWAIVRRDISYSMHRLTSSYWSMSSFETSICSSVSLRESAYVWRTHICHMISVPYTPSSIQEVFAIIQSSVRGTRRVHRPGYRVTHGGQRTRAIVLTRRSRRLGPS